MTWQIESFLDVGGNKNSEFGIIADLPAAVDVPLELAYDVPDEVLDELRARGWKLRGPCPRCRTTPTCTATTSQACSASSVSRSRRTSARGAAGSAIARSASSPSGGPRSCRTPVGRPTSRPARDCSPSPPPTRHAPRSKRSSPIQLHARAEAEIARSHFAHDVVLPALLERAVSTPSPRCVDADRLGVDAGCAGGAGTSGAGSVEGLVWALADGCQRAGHEVTVFGAAGSCVPGELVATLPVRT